MKIKYIRGGGVFVFMYGSVVKIKGSGFFYKYTVKVNIILWMLSSLCIKSMQHFSKWAVVCGGEQGCSAPYWRQWWGRQLFHGQSQDKGTWGFDLKKTYRNFLLWKGKWAVNSFNFHRKEARMICIFCDYDQSLYDRKLDYMYFKDRQETQ